MWFRGRSKQKWIDKLIRSYRVTNGLVISQDRQRTIEKREGLSETQRVDLDIEELRVMTRVGVSGWTKIIFLTLFLVLLPCMLAFAISFNTPRTGISCRSFTFLIYGVIQILQVALFVWSYISYSRNNSTTGKLSSTQTSPIQRPLSSRFSFLDSQVGRGWGYVWYILVTIFASGAGFVAIGGTMMQLIGVYRNCLCSLPMRYWSDRNNIDATFPIGQNSKQDIHLAWTTWRSTSGAAIGFLGLATYYAW
jgi:hypothetical protein